MKNNYENKKKGNRKVLLILVLLLLIGISGLVGYGVYSYYYTTGTIYTGSDEIQISSFYPNLYYNSDNWFLHGDHYTGSTSCELTSYSSTNQQAVYTCTGDIVVFNSGSNPISVVGSNLQLNYDGPDSGNVSISNQTISYEGDNNHNNVSVGGNVTVLLSATVTVSNVTVDPDSVSSEAQYASEPVYGASITSIAFTVDITATELQN